ncbi:tRNA (cytidine(56)-2'-O)-methyltransferase [Candidatus Micrarchaeota archaeon]|nr:tRNA (cytidine(56)-2'-O)-methyltransferase [Candidatus Micrarchaeota archaeon]
MIFVLRLGHRLPRDERITTHVALVSRAFGADGIIYSGQHDGSLEKTVESIAGNWGGRFAISYEKNFLNVIRDYKKKGFVIIHMTMYGIPLPELETKIKTNKKAGESASGNVLVVVGAERVPKEVYELADYNVSVTSQPHSEVAALAILLDRLQGGKELERNFDEHFKGKIRLRPNERGKTIEKTA